MKPRLAVCKRADILKRQFGLFFKGEQERRPGFVHPGFARLANALPALYPKDSEEKILLDAMLLAVPR